VYWKSRGKRSSELDPIALLVRLREETTSKLISYSITERINRRKVGEKVAGRSGSRKNIPKLSGVSSTQRNFSPECDSRNSLGDDGAGGRMGEKRRRLLVR